MWQGVFNVALATILFGAAHSLLAGAWATAGGDGEMPADPYFAEPA